MADPNTSRVVQPKARGVRRVARRSASLLFFLIVRLREASDALRECDLFIAVATGPYRGIGLVQSSRSYDLDATQLTDQFELGFCDRLDRQARVFQKYHFGKFGVCLDYLQAHWF